MRNILRTISYGAMMVSALGVFTACGDELPDPQMKPRTALTLQADWSACGLENTPNTYFLSVNKEVSTISGNTQQLSLKSNYDYSFLLYTGNSNMTLDETTQTVAVQKSKFVVDDAAAINGNPDTFCYGAASESALSGDAKEIQVQMKRITRKLNLSFDAAVLQGTDGGEATVQGGYAILTNAYSVYNLANGTANTPVTAVSEIALNQDAHTIDTPFNLLGIDLSEPVELAYVISMSDGTTRNFSATTDMAAVLANFNNGDLTDVNAAIEVEDDDATPKYEYNNIYAFGSATPGGWSMGDAPTLMTKKGNVYTVELNLTEGELKFALNNDWGCDWIMPTQGGASLSHGECERVLDGEQHDDNKWYVSADEAGKYKLVLRVNPKSTLCTLTATKID